MPISHPAAGGSLLEAVDVVSKPQGVVETRGMCDERPDAPGTPDKAYKITKQAVLTVPTANLFPGEYHKAVTFVVVVIFLCLQASTSFTDINNYCPSLRL